MKKGAVKRFLGWTVVVLVAALAVVYVGDWAVWRVRVMRGGGMGSVAVSSMSILDMKGDKQEYYWDGTERVACSQSIFPHSGGGACWWLQRHHIVYEQ